MKIVITGATGFVGQLLVPELLEAGCKLLLVGRNPEKIGQTFPGVEACDYANWQKRGAGHDALVHLAAINSDADMPDQEFFSVNVDLLVDLARKAKHARIKRFINISSVHSLDLSNATNYARSKREGAAAIAALDGLETQTVYLPLVYGNRWAGKLTRLNSLPLPLARLAFVPLAALKPTVNIDKLTAYILSDAPLAPDEEVILFDNQDKNQVYVWSKRAIDLSFAFAVTALLGWVLVLIWAAIRLESPGPGIFAQARVGKGGRIFTCYKFRTMKEGTKQAGTHEVSVAAVTRLGAFLRKTKIDELPQVWNIFRNDISLIGPRPCLPVQEELFEARKSRGVLAVKPGISGLAQVNGIDMSDPAELVRWDARYIAIRSFLLDQKIAVATATGGGQGDRTSSHLDAL